MVKLAAVESREKAERLDNSVQFDLNLWSDRPEFGTIVDPVLNELKRLPGFYSRPNVRLKHLRSLLLNLYNSWSTDPSKYVSYHRGNDYYSKSKLPNRYNSNGIKQTLIDVVDAMVTKGFLENEDGHYGRDGTWTSHVSRMKPLPKLNSVFAAVPPLSNLIVYKSPSTECVILRDLDPVLDKQVEIDYTDRPETLKMRGDLTTYNNQLFQTHIDIPFYPKGGIPTKSGKRNIYIDRSDKFVRRIFNNGSWEEGGRFYGGWWQRIPKEWRERIKINAVPVVEIDYSGLHIVLLYVMEGIDYWGTIGDDPYSIPYYVKSEEMRKLLKLVLLSAINAKDKKTAVKAVRYEIRGDLRTWGWVYAAGLNLEKLVEDFANRHHPIRTYFFTGKGISLQRIDSIMAEHIINRFTEKGLAVLCVHDSFIVQSNYEDELNSTMQEGFELVVNSLSSCISGMKSRITKLGVTAETFLKHQISDIMEFPTLEVSGQTTDHPLLDPEYRERSRAHILNCRFRSGFYR